MDNPKAMPKFKINDFIFNKKIYYFKRNKQKTEKKKI